MIREVGWSADGRRIVCAGDPVVVVSDVASGTVSGRFSTEGTPAVSVDFSDDGRSLAIGTYDGSILIFDADTGERQRRLRGHRGPVRAVHWQPQDRRRLASASDDGTVRVWDTDNGYELLVFRDHRSSVEAVAWSPDGGRLGSGSTDKTVNIWTIPPPAQTARTPAPLGLRLQP